MSARVMRVLAGLPRCVDCARLLLDGQPCTCAWHHDTGSRTEADAAAWEAAHAPDDEPEMTRWDDLT